MIYKIIRFVDGTEEKCPADKYSDAQLKEVCEKIGRPVESIRTLALVDFTEEEKPKMYFKVIWGFDDERTTEIESKDLEKAIYAMSAQVKVNLGDVMLDGKYIIAIKENWQRTMGWNPTHELSDDDWVEIKNKGVLEMYRGYLGEVKERVQYIVSTNQQKYIGQNLSIEQMEHKRLN